MIGTAGHVDHGKTALLAALTGIDTDRLPEEKSRGMTIDLGFAYIDFPKVGRVSVVDVPGHERLLKNMLAGAWSIDVALMCIAADEGIKPQTREHFEILKLLQTKKMVIAITKCDSVEKEYQQLVEIDVIEMIKGSIFQESPIIQVSAFTGTGIQTLKDQLEKAILALSKVSNDSPWFLPIDRVFTLPGHGTIVTGTIAKGQVWVGDAATLFPHGNKVRIRSIEVHGNSVKTSEQGLRTALNLAGIKHTEIKRGHVVGSPEIIALTQCINIHYDALEPLKHGMRVRAHIGTGEFIGRIFLFDYARNVAQIRLEEIVACTKDQKILLRNYSPPNLLAGATIITPYAKERRKKDPSIKDQVLQSSNMMNDEQLILSILSKNATGTDVDTVCEALGQTSQQLGNAFETLKTTKQAYSFAGIWVTPEQLQTLSHELQNKLWLLHEQSPNLPWISKNDLNQATFRWPPKAFDRWIAYLSEIGMIQVNGALVRHPDHEIRLNKRQQDLMNKMVELMKTHGINAETPQKYATTLNIPIQAVNEIQSLGIMTGDMVQIAPGLIYAKDTIDEIKNKLLSFENTFTIAQFRNLFQTTRKYAIPVLEYLDNIKFTKRVGDERVILH